MDGGVGKGSHVQPSLANSRLLGQLIAICRSQLSDTPKRTGAVRPCLRDQHRQPARYAVLQRDPAGRDRRVDHHVPAVALVVEDLQPMAPVGGQRHTPHRPQGNLSCTTRSREPRWVAVPLSSGRAVCGPSSPCRQAVMWLAYALALPCCRGSRCRLPFSSSGTACAGMRSARSARPTFGGCASAAPPSRPTAPCFPAPHAWSRPASPPAACRPAAA